MKALSLCAIRSVMGLFDLRSQTQFIGHSRGPYGSPQNYSDSLDLEGERAVFRQRMRSSATLIGQLVVLFYSRKAKKRKNPLYG